MVMLYQRIGLLMGQSLGHVFLILAIVGQSEVGLVFLVIVSQHL